MASRSHHRIRLRYRRFALFRNPARRFDELSQADLVSMRAVSALRRKYLRASSKLKAAASTKRERTRFVNPGIAFGSTIIVGIRKNAAINNVGPDEYPPTPITTS